MDKEELIERILDKQDKMSIDITDVKIIITRQEENISHHIKRTDLAEENIKLLREQLANDLKPIKSHVAFINAVLKICGGLGFLVSLIAGIVKILSFFS